MSFLNRLGVLAGGQIASPLASRGALEVVTISDLAGVKKDHTFVTRKEAMSVAAVAKGRQLITGAIARLPLIAMTGTTISESPSPILKQIEDGRPMFITLQWVVDSLFFYGRAHLEVTKRNSDGKTIRARFIPEWQITEIHNSYLETTNGRKIPSADIIRIDGPHEGILNFAADRISVALRLDRAAANASDNPVPLVELHQVGGQAMTTDEAKKLIAAYEAARRKSGVSYTNQTIETKVHGAPPENLLIDGRKAAALDLARVMSLPAWAVDASVEGTSLSYSNVPSRARELVDYTFSPYMESITARLSMDDILPRGQWCQFDTDKLLRDDFGTRMKDYKAALETGVYTLEELRNRERGIPLETAGK